MSGRPKPRSISTKRRRIAELANQMPGVALTSLSHHIDTEWLREAHDRTRKDGAVGVDGETAAEYAEQLETRLEALLSQAKSGRYRAPPVRRVYIPKEGTTEERPLGIPTFEDKVLQRAAVMALEPVYETDFLDCSYGFRPGRSAHQALKRVWDVTREVNGGWIYDIDIRKFFDRIPKDRLQELVRLRVRDGVLLRLIGKWLNAGVMEEGNRRNPDTGTPQGGVISPLLANIFLHYVVDLWFAEEVKPRLYGRGELIRFADDMVMIFEREDDARRVAKVLPQRLARYGLELHPEKTRLVRFCRPPRRRMSREEFRSQRPESFDFLGFRHHWRRGRRGNWVVGQKTLPSRLTRAIRRVWQWCRRERHAPLKEQQKTLRRKLRGHYNYYGITANYPAIAGFYRAVERAWQYWLARRGGKRKRSWKWFKQMLLHYPLLRPRITKDLRHA